MLACDCETVEFIHDATAEGTTARLIVECPVCELSSLLTYTLVSITPYSDARDDWEEEEPIKIN